MSNNIYRAILWIIVGTNLGAITLTRLPNSLTAEYTPALYYSFFILWTIVPIVHGYRKLLQSKSTNDQGKLISKLVLTQGCLVILGILLQIFLPNYFWIKIIVCTATSIVLYQMLIKQTKLD